MAAGDSSEFVEFKGCPTWRYFLRGTGERKGWAKCIVENKEGDLCNSILSMGKKSSTGSLNNHLRCKHKIIAKTEGSDDCPVVLAKKPKDSLEKKVCKLVALDGLSFRTLVTSDVMKDLFSKAGHELPDSANTIRAIVLSFAKETREEMARTFAELRSAGFLFSLTMDEWTSMGSRRFANVNVHCNGRTFSLGLFRCFGSMPAEKCRDLVYGALAEYGLEKRDIVGITTDAAKVMVKMGRQLGFDHHHCMAHGLHLAVMDVLYSDESISAMQSMIDAGDHQEEVLQKEEDEDGESFGLERVPAEQELEISRNFNLKALVGKVRDVVHVFNYSPVRKDALDKHVTDDHGKVLGLLPDCKTRWNSTFDMLERFLRIRVSVVKALADVNSNIQFSELELQGLAVVCNALKIVKETLICLCRRDANLLEMDSALSCLLERMDRCTPFGKALLAALVRRIGERRTITSNVMKYLHTGGTNQINSSFKTNTYEEMDLYLTKLWARMNPEEADEEVVVVEDELDSSPPDDFAEFLKWSIKMNCEEIPLNYSRGSLGELLRELHDFKETKVRGPKLNMIFKNLKAIQVTSVESERSFSLSGRFMNKLRGRLSDMTVGALTLLHHYFTNNE